MQSNFKLQTISSLVNPPPGGSKGLSNATLGLRVSFPTVNLGLSCIFSMFARLPAAVTSASIPPQSALGVPVNLLGSVFLFPVGAGSATAFSLSDLGTAANACAPALPQLLI